MNIAVTRAFCKETKKIMSDYVAKRFTHGEFGLLVFFSLFSFVALLGAAFGQDQAYTFHALLFCAASAAAVLAIGNRYIGRSAVLPPQEINGKPNYNFGPVKFATIAAVSWGIAG